MALQFNPYPLEPWILKQQNEQRPDFNQTVTQPLLQGLQLWQQSQDDQRKAELEKWNQKYKATVAEQELWPGWDRGVPNPDSGLLLGSTQGTQEYPSSPTETQQITPQQSYGGLFAGIGKSIPERTLIPTMRGKTESIGPRADYFPYWRAEQAGRMKTNVHPKSFITSSGKPDLSGEFNKWANIYQQAATPYAKNKALENMTKLKTMMPTLGDSGKSVSDLRKELADRQAVKDYISVSTQINSMDSLLSNALSGNMDSALALDQGLITMYNKLTDPQSVVRESEYARTPDNLPMTNRIVGAIDKLKQGGAGLTMQDREALVIGAKIIGNERGKMAQNSIDFFTKEAEASGVEPWRVIGDVPSFTPYDVITKKVKKAPIGGRPQTVEQNGIIYNWNPETNQYE